MTENELLTWIQKNDTRFHFNAYRFVLEALQFTQKRLGGRRHISGQELLDGVKDYAWAQYGSMALEVFEEWGLKTTRDVGTIVFNLVNMGEIRKTEEDSIEDFDSVYEFSEVFREEAHRGPKKT